MYTQCMHTYMYVCVSVSTDSTNQTMMWHSPDPIVWWWWRWSPSFLSLYYFLSFFFHNPLTDLTLLWSLLFLSLGKGCSSYLLSTVELIKAPWPAVCANDAVNHAFVTCRPMGEGERGLTWNLRSVRGTHMFLAPPVAHLNHSSVSNLQWLQQLVNKTAKPSRRLWGDSDETGCQRLPPLWLPHIFTSN